MQHVSFKSSSRFKSIADKVFAEQKKRVLNVISQAEIHHIGSTAIPGSVTKGDLDVNIRVERKDLDYAIEQLKHLYKISQPDNWTSDFASFKDEESLEIDFGVQLTVKGSKVDDFVKLKDVLVSNPRLVKEYNKMKIKYEDKDMVEYRKEKANFFQRLREDKL